MAAGGVMVGRGYVSIRPEFEGDWSRGISARASSAGSSGGSAFSKSFGRAIGAGMKGVAGLLGVSLGSSLAPAIAATAALAPALATAGAAAGALKLGLSGVGEAFKAAFADSTAQASSAASATRAVEAAQRGLANAQRSLADARVQAAERVVEAQKAVRDAERDLADAQRDARGVQAELTDARLEATRALQDMNQRLAESQLDEREAVLRLKEAQEELTAAQKKPGADPDELAKLQLAYERAQLNLTEQRRETKRLSDDTKAANKAGVDGSEQVRAARQEIADADQNVADKQRALADAQAGVDQARRDGARQVADAQRAVADAAAAIADAQAAAAAQTSQLDQAMAKLAPNARSFVEAIRGVAPAWDDMRLSVQNQLFAGLDTQVSSLARATIPTLKSRLTETAGVFNNMAKSAIGAVAEMQKTGMLDQILAGAAANLRVFEDAPGRIVTAFGQLTVAAQPAFNKMLTGFNDSITSVTDKLAASFASGGLQQAITTAFTLLSQLGSILGDAFGAVGNIMKAAADGGGQALAVVGELFAELRRVTAMPEVQAALRTIFASVAQIAAAIAPIFGAALQALLPLLAAIAPVFAQLAQSLGPVLVKLVEALGAALEPILEALLPVVTLVGDALIKMVSALTPLLEPIGAVLGAIIEVLTPALEPIVKVITGVVEALAGPLAAAIEALMPWLETLGQLFTQVFGALEPLIEPLLQVVTTLANLFVTVFATAIEQVISAVQPAIPMFVELISALVAGLVPVLPVITDLLMLIVDLFLDLGVSLFKELLPPLLELNLAFVDLIVALTPILPPLVKLIGLVASLAVGVLSTLLPPLVKFVGFLVDKLVGPLVDAIKMFKDWATAIREKAGPAFQFIGDKVKSVWEKFLKPAFDSIKAGVRAVSESFDKAKGFIDKAWSKVSDIAKKPVKFIIETVYNKGIVPTWNKIATAFGADPLKTLPIPKGFARGGVLPGMSSWRGGDDQLVPMRRGEGVYVSEAMRDPYERARLYAVNRAAMQGRSLTGFQQEGFARGGIFDWIGNTASAGLDAVKSGVAWIKDGIRDSAVAGMNEIVKPLLSKIAGSASLYRDMISGIPKRMLDAIFGYSGQADRRMSEAGVGGKGYKSGLSFARRQAGKPYIWGGVGPAGFDCSGFMGAIENVIRGMKPNTRRWATGAFSGRTAPGGWILNHRSPFMVGITNAGVGHTAGTLNGVNVESRGGDGVVVGSRARGANSMLFTDVYGLKYDAGGWLQPGVTATVNATGQPEAVLTAGQWQTMRQAVGGPARFEGDLYLDSGEFLGKVRGVAEQTVDDTLRPAVAAMRANRRGA
ncbi:hypothetical protein [Streptomyces sp. NPDC056543]|uniref:hypothetical protein n=1 Tax=unclassified Streptomyces TaxID=2593676 RepID=UPI0036B65F75